MFDVFESFNNGIEDSHVTDIDFELESTGSPSYRQQMLDAIDATDQYAQQRGIIGGYKISFPEMMTQLEGIQVALYTIAAQTNQGKTLILLKLAYDLATMNDNVLVRYYSLDDCYKRTIPRVIASTMDIPISVVEKPVMWAQQQREDLLEKRGIGMARMRNIADKLNIIGEDMIGSCNIEDIISDIENVACQLEEERLLTGVKKKLIICLDSFNKLTSSTRGIETEAQLIKHSINIIKTAIKKYDMPWLMTSEIKKINGFRRPMIDDLRESCEQVYRADVAILGYSEVGSGKPGALIYHDGDTDEDHLPVFEAHFAKNKTSAFKGRLFYKQWTDKSKIVEATKEETRQWLASVTG